MFEGWVASGAAGTLTVLNPTGIVETVCARPNEANARRATVQRKGTIRRMVDVRSGADVMFFGAKEQGKLLLFMKISLFIDIGVATATV
jgi:hypothetical protein